MEYALKSALIRADAERDTWMGLTYLFRPGRETA